MTRTYTETVTLQEDTCIVCGITFAAPQHWFKGKQNTGDTFYCPNGHMLTYRETTEKRLHKELQTEQERIQALELQLTRVKDQLEASEREMKRHKKRVANGVCPCCHRSFVQLQRHMQTRHPEYGEGKGAR